MKMVVWSYGKIVAMEVPEDWRERDDVGCAPITDPDKLARELEERLERITARQLEINRYRDKHGLPRIVHRENESLFGRGVGAKEVLEVMHQLRQARKEVGA